MSPKYRFHDGEIRYGFIKPAIDAHTLGINAAAELLRTCGCDVIIAEDSVAEAMNDYLYEVKRQVAVDWMIRENINRLGISYRLDKNDAVRMMGYLLEEMRKNRLLHYQGGPVDAVCFAGLPEACRLMEQEFDGLVTVFQGGESDRETLGMLGVPEEKIPMEIREGSRYDEARMGFGRQIVASREYRKWEPADPPDYPDYGTERDTVEKRLNARKGARGSVPLTRAHVGPYSSEVSREENVKEFLSWVKTLAGDRYLDIISIGSSQLTQSDFGGDWDSKVNGGGVPIHSPEEYRMVWEASRPLFLRTYAGTRDIPALARMYEETIHICWHALSLWWFNRLDGRGPYDVYTNLKQHIETIRYIAGTNKLFEANVSHHFAFRGADDVTYIVSAYLAAKLAKKLGIRTFVLQNMLNTPRSTWGIQDLAKSRAMVKLVRSLEDRNFRVILQPRAGLDYFKPDMEEARMQLAAVTALMDDIDPHNEADPPIIHVVSYSEASRLATPDIIKESIRITQHSLQKYREERRMGKVEDMSRNRNVAERSAGLLQSSGELLTAMEETFDDLYSAEGLYKVLAAGFLPVPWIWGETEEFRHARDWITKPVKGGVAVVDENHKVMSMEDRIAIVRTNCGDAEYYLKQRMQRGGILY